MTVRTSLVIAANVGIIFMAYLTGAIGKASGGIGCFYAQQPWGSACRRPEVQAELQTVFWEWFVGTALVLYAVWGIGFFVRRLLKAR